MDAEEWRPVVGYEGLYEVSSLGRVRRVLASGHGAFAGKVLRVCMSRMYGRVKLCAMDGAVATSRNARVHRLVATAFIPNPKRKRTVNHLNGIKTDNRVENLEWATHSENHLHAYRVLGNPGRGPRGERAHLAVLSWEKVRSIRGEYACGQVTQRELAAKYAVSRRTVRDVLNGRTWRTPQKRVT